MSMLRAELIKLWRPLTIALTVLIAALAVMSLEHAQVEGRQALSAVHLWQQNQADFTSGTIGVTTGDGQTITCSRTPGVKQNPQCGQILASLTQAQQANVQKQIDTVDAASLQQNPLGVGTQAGGLLASLLGFFAVTLIAAAHVASYGVV